MKIDITGRQVDITPALREHTEEKLRRLARLLDDPVEAHVVLAITKHRQIAEIQVTARNISLSGTEETGDLYASIAEVVDKLERQALRHKEKLTDHKHRGSPRDPEVSAALLAPSENPSGNDGTQAVRRVIHNRRYELKPMTAEDAVLELETSRGDLLVFREARTDRINVVHRRTDGHFEVIDPEP